MTPDPTDDELAMLACLRARHICQSQAEVAEHPERLAHICDPFRNPSPSIQDVRDYLNKTRVNH